MTPFINFIVRKLFFTTTMVVNEERIKCIMNKIYGTFGKNMDFYPSAFFHSKQIQ